MKALIMLLGVVSCGVLLRAQEGQKAPSQSGWFSLGGRSTLSSFSEDGSGLGMGGQFRIQLNNRVNTDWFADYISINEDGKVRSDYYHIGWSVLFYPIKYDQLPKFQPYFLAGHCFDYNVKSSIRNPDISRSRWGSAAQAGLGFHWNLTPRLDLSLTAQYMIHLTSELDAEMIGDDVTGISEKSNPALEGHLLTTMSFNYKIFKLWGRN